MSRSAWRRQARTGPIPTYYTYYYHIYCPQEGCLFSLSLFLFYFTNCFFHIGWVYTARPLLYQTPYPVSRNSSTTSPRNSTASPRPRQHPPSPTPTIRPSPKTLPTQPAPHPVASHSPLPPPCRHQQRSLSGILTLD